MRVTDPRPIFFLLAALVALPLHAEEEEDVSQLPPDVSPSVEVEPVDFEQLKKEREIASLRYRLGQRVQRYLEAAGQLAEEEKAEEADALLTHLQDSRLNPLEKAYVFRLAGFIAYSAGNPEVAIDYFKRALELRAIPVREESSLRYGIAQLTMGLGDWAEALRWFKSWLSYTRKPDPNGYFVMSIAYYQLKAFDAAIAHIEKAREVTDKPQESWLRLLSALHAEKQDYEAAGPVLEELVLRYPAKQYWIQLSLIQAAREKYDISLAVQQLAYAQGFIEEEKDLLRLARSYLFHDLPYEAALVLDAELEAGRLEAKPANYEMLANSWIAAREYERSLPPLRRAAELAESGDFFVRLGQVHMQREEWDKAAEYLQRALEKGDMEGKQGSAQILLGIAHYNDGNLTAARGSFERARRHEKNRDEADRWLQHIAKELSQAA